jgi:hypothetical protein
MCLKDQTCFGWFGEWRPSALWLITALVLQAIAGRELLLGANALPAYDSLHAPDVGIRLGHGASSQVPS